MELTPKLLTEDVDFRRAYRGYDPDEVDDFLERVAVAVGQLQTQLAEAVERARAAEGRVQQAQREADDARRQAAHASQGAPAPAPVASAPAPVDPASAAAAAREADDLNEELRRTLVLAQRTADAAIREAREQSMKITAEADERAQRRIADAEAEARRKSDEARSKLLAEIAELEGIRESFRSDVTVLERHLEEQRLQLRSTLQELQRLLDDPGSFRVEPVPPLSGVSAPRAPSELPPARPPRQVAPGPERPARPSAPNPAARPAPAAPPASPAAGSQGPPSGEVTFRGATPAGASPTPDAGPRTQPVSAARFEADESDDAFLAELRRAMADEEPLGPRAGEGGTEDDDGGRRPRFGRRR